MCIRDSLYSSPQEAKLKYFQDRAFEAQLAETDIQEMLKMLASIEEQTEECEIDGALVTANQIDDYVHRGNHPLVKGMSLYMYSVLGVTCWNYSRTKSNRASGDSFSSGLQPG